MISLKECYHYAITMLSSNGLFIAISVSVMAEKASVEKWSVYNIELKGPSTGNPFTDSKLSA